MAQRTDFNDRSNDDLVRLLYQGPSPTKPPKTTLPPPPREETPEPLASRRVSELPPQTWPLNNRKPDLSPLSEREERALYAALSKGSKANLGREPTLPELMMIVERVNDARAFIAEVEQVMQGNDGVYIKDGRIVFSRPPQRRDLPGRRQEAA